MKQLIKWIAIACLSMTSSAYAVTIDFEGTTTFTDVGGYYSSLGVQFGPNWEFYGNDALYPAHSGTNNVVLRTPTATIDFFAPVADVSAWFNVYAYPLTVSAYDASHTFLGSFTAMNTSQPTPGGMKLYSLLYSNISRLEFSVAQGNFLNMDDLSFTTASVPEPSSVFLIGLGVLALGVGMRRKAV